MATNPTPPEMRAPQDSSLLLDLPVPFRRIGGHLHVEAQALNGLARWLDNFDRLSLCAPLLPEHMDNPSEHQLTWVPLDELSASHRLEPVPLPWAYDPLRHAWHRPAVARLLRQLIARNRYLCFSNLGWLGGWGNVAADEASRSGRAYSVWLDWVLHEMPPANPGGWLKQAYGVLNRSRLKRDSMRAVRRASLGLFHGNTVYSAYAPLCRRACLVHDVHLSCDDLIQPQALQARLDRLDELVHIGYVGRVHAMKGPMQWIDTLATLCNRSPQLASRVRATWLGDGPLLEAARERVRALGMSEQISFPGAEAERERVLHFLRTQDIFLFCHLTPESPRCLIEALMSALPLVGFDSAYARDLVSHAPQAGRFAPLGDAKSLAAELQAMLERGPRSGTQAQAALECGQAFSDQAVFQHRSELIKAHLP